MQVTGNIAGMRFNQRKRKKTWDILPLFNPIKETRLILFINLHTVKISPTDPVQNSIKYFCATNNLWDQIVFKLKSIRVDKRKQKINKNVEIYFRVNFQASIWILTKLVYLHPRCFHREFIFHVYFVFFVENAIILIDFN